jgi:hypothetical protein
VVKICAALNVNVPVVSVVHENEENVFAPDTVGSPVFNAEYVTVPYAKPPPAKLALVFDPVILIVELAALKVIPVDVAIFQTVAFADEVFQVVVPRVNDLVFELLEEN